METKPKKHLGQNFLRDHVFLERIIRSVDFEGVDFVLEIGPGEGILTERLMRFPPKVFAVELDNSLAKKLKKRFEKEKKLEVINQDILKLNLPEFFANQKGRLGIQGEAFRYKIVANIPYYITSPIIRLFLETPFQPEEMILMVQKEVARRICSRPGEMSLLGLSVNYYAFPEVLFEVPKEAFWPVPEVDSAVIRIKLEKKWEKDVDKLFFRIARMGFSARRKTLVNNLAAGLGIPKDQVASRLEEVGFSRKARPQELGVSDWRKINRVFT